MKMKKIVSLLMAMTMAVSVTACGNTDDAGSADTTVAQKEQAVQTEESNLETETVNYYGFDEPVSIKVGWAFAEDFSFGNGDDTQNNPWNNLYAENNIITEILYEVDSSQADTKLSTSMMSGNYPDIFTISPNEYARYVESGAIADISEALERYATPELKEYLAVDGGLAMDALSMNGALYGLPKMGNAYDSANLMFVRQDWLDNLGLKMPETMEELKEVAYAFTYNDPDGNGKDDTYGLALDGVDVLTSTIGTMSGIFEGFGAYPESLSFVEHDGEVVWGGSLSDGMKAALTMLQEMYAEGSITRDFITMDGNSVFEEGGSGRCGIFFGPMWAAMTSSNGALNQSREAMFSSAPIPDGTGAGDGKAYLSGSYESIFVVSSQCEHPEVLVKLMNLSVQKLCYPETEEEFNTYYGTVDSYSVWKVCLTPSLAPLKNYDNYKKESAALQTGNTSELNVEQMSDYENQKYYLEQLEAGDFDIEDSVFMAGCSLYTVFGNPKGAYAALDNLIQTECFTYAAYNTLPTFKMSEVEATLDKLTKEMIIKIVVGDSVDNYDAFLESWYSLGGKEITEEAAAWAESVN